LVADARETIERDLESRLGLASARPEGRTLPAPPDLPAPPGPRDPVGPTRIVFRVSRGAYAVPRAMSITGTDSQLGDVEPNVVLMHDDGTGGDERAGDGVWSFAATFAPATRLTYVYT